MTDIDLEHATRQMVDDVIALVMADLDDDTADAGIALAEEIAGEPIRALLALTHLAGLAAVIVQGLAVENDDDPTELIRHLRAMLTEGVDRALEAEAGS